MIDYDYLYATRYAQKEDFIPASDSVYLYGKSVEGRSAHVDELSLKSQDVKYYNIESMGPYSFQVSAENYQQECYLRSESQLNSLLEEFGDKLIYIDITGLEHRVWARLLRSAIRGIKQVKVLYVEPKKYKLAQFQTEGIIHDLSEEIQGISPLPGFSFFSRKVGEQVCFIPLLGFEGARFRYLLETVQPLDNKIFPVIGVPGFRPEYPFVAYWGNRQPLIESQAWRNVQFATANSAVDLFFILGKMHEKYPNDILKIAPIGTKPHAIGAVLYAIKNPDHTELVYDHPIRKQQRTEGTARLIEYHATELVNTQFNSI